MLMTSFGLKRFTGVLYLLAWYSPHEAVTARKAPFRTRRGSGTRLMKHVLFEHKHERYLCSKESFHHGCERRASLSPEYRGKNAKKNRPKRQCASRQEVIQ